MPHTTKFLPVRLVVADLGRILLATVKYDDDILCVAEGCDKSTAVRSVVHAARSIRRLRNYLLRKDAQRYLRLN